MRLSESAEPTGPGRAEIPLGVDDSSSGGQTKLRRRENFEKREKSK